MDDSISDIQIPKQNIKLPPSRAKVKIEQYGELADARAEGKSVTSLAKEYGMSPGNMYLTLKKPEIATLIRAKAEELYLRNIPKASDNITGIIHKENPDKDDYKLQLQYSEKVLQGAGILSGGGTSGTYITQIFNQMNIVPSPVVKEIIDKHFGGFQFTEEDEK
jgi:hypothetical protein